MVKSIFLQDGEEIFVDDEDYKRVNQYTWMKDYKNDSARNTRRIITRNGNKTLFLKNFIMRKSCWQKVKNNYFTKDNLTNSGHQNNWQKAKWNNSSKYKGVSWNKSANKWKATISHNGTKHLGYYINEDDAAHAYNQAVLDYWNGEGYLNVIGEDNRLMARDYQAFNKQKRRRVGKLGYKGVVKRQNSYMSYIYRRSSQFYIGKFSNKHHAALAYNKCAIYLHGDDAILNDVPMTGELKEFISNWEIPEKIKQLKENNNE